MNKKLIIILSVCFLALMALNGCTKTEKDTFLKDIPVGIIGNDIPIDRATVSKMLALANYNKNDILAFDTIINFEDVYNDMWYSKYINTAYINGDISGISATKFDPMGNLTITQTQYLIQKYDKTKKIKIDDTNKDKPVSYALWCDIYEQIMKDKGVILDEVVILATKDNSKELKEDFAITDKGLLSFEGLSPSLYIDKSIKILRKGTEVIAVTEVIEDKPTLKRALIKKVADNYMEVFIGGATKKLYYTDIEINKASSLADIKIDGNNIIGIDYYQDIIRGDINKITDDIIRINNTNYQLDNNFKVYSLNGDEVLFKNKKDLIIGEDIANFYTKNGESKIYSAIIDTETTGNKIRVAINDSSFNNLYFDSVELEAESGLNILVKGNAKQLPSLNVKNGSDFSIGENEIIIIEPVNKSDGITFKNLKRNEITPKFFGRIEICKVGNKYTVINELSFEDYVICTLASTTYTEPEMLKTLAVLYRTRAASYMLENNLHNIGANVDDSSKYQLLNTTKVDNIHMQAATDTKNQIMTNDNKSIEPVYFGVSGGTTANSGEIWASRDYYEYPAENKSYLTHRKFFPEDNYPDLKNEQTANMFFREKNINALEQDNEWFRWNSLLDKDKINNISSKTLELSKDNKHLIKVLVDGEYIYKQIDDLGKIKDIKIVERGDGGNVIKLEIIFEKETVLITTDNLIKQILNTTQTTNNLGNTFENINIPSSFFTLDKVYDNEGYLQKLNVYGGGYGHGVGLSLYGAEKLTMQGESYEDVLKAYYKNIAIEDR